MYKIFSERMLLLAVLFIINEKSQAASQKDTTQLIDKIFADWQGNNPGGVLKITRYGQTIYSKSFGMANMEDEIKNSEETVFEAGSVSKQFTATSVLLLVQDGRLKLDDDIHKYIPELPAYGHTINIKHLLTHTSGLKDWRNITYITGWPTGTKVYTQDHAIFYICKQQSLNFIPGSQYSYSNSNFDLLSILIARISGKSFAGFVQDRLLKPAGMTQSRVRTNFKEIIKHKALGYNKSGNNYLLTLPFEETAGASGIITNAGDLTKWNYFINSGELGAQVTALRLTQQVLNDGRKISYTYGGINVHKINGVTELSHGGLVGGYRAWLAFYPEKGISVAYTSNIRSLESTIVASKIAEIFLGEAPGIDSSSYQFIRMPAKQLAGKTGLYRNKETDAIIELDLKDGQLQIRHGAALKALSANRFIAGNKQVDFTEKQNMFVLEDNDTTVYEKLTEYRPSANTLTRFSGNFFSADCETTVKIVPKGGHLLVSRNSFDTLSLTPYYSDARYVTFKGTDNGLRVLYSFPVNDRNTNSFLISIPRAANIPFLKTIK